jgi:hypothetical protein
MVVPQTFAAVASFFLLVAPGAFFEIRRERRRPSKTESALREASRIVLASLVFSGVAAAVVALAQMVWPADWPPLAPDFGRWLEQGNAYAADNLGLIARVAAAQFVVAVLASYLASRLLERKERGWYSSDSMWRRLLHTKVPAGNDPYGRVELESGAVYGGVATEFGTSNKKDERDLGLGGPQLVYRSGGNGQVESLLDKGYTRVIIPSSAIRTIWISYRMKAGDQAPSPAKETPLPAATPEPGPDGAATAHR